MDELRSILDEATIILRRASANERQTLLAANPSTTAHSDMTVAEAKNLLDSSLDDAIAMEARLSLRADEDEIASYFRACLNELTEIANVYVGVERYADMQREDLRELMAHRRALEASLRSFIERGRTLVGPRKEALEQSAAKGRAALDSEDAAPTS